MSEQGAEHTRIAGDGRELDAYLALPRGRDGPAPAVIVIHEIFGPVPHIEDVARRFAAKGYLAVAPNLFTGEIQKLLTPEAITTGFTFLRSLPPEVQRSPAQIQQRIGERPPEERKLLGALLRIQDPAEHLHFARDLVRVAEALRARRDVEPTKVGSVGFCFGGGMSGLLACQDPKLAAAVIFYGNSPPAEEVARIRCPVLGLYGAEDHRITDTVPALAEAARAHGVSFSYHVYPGAQHAFFNDGRPMYHEASAKDAWQRVLEFFGTHLGPPVP